MVNIFSLYAPLINQLKVARLISAGFLHAFTAVRTSTNTTVLWKECTSHVHRYLPRLLQPGFPWRCFPAPELCFHQRPLLQIPSEPRCPSSLKMAHAHPCTRGADTSTEICSDTTHQPLQVEEAMEVHWTTHTFSLTADVTWKEQ